MNEYDFVYAFFLCESWYSCKWSFHITDELCSLGSELGRWVFHLKRLLISILMIFSIAALFSQVGTTEPELSTRDWDHSAMVVDEPLMFGFISNWDHTAWVVDKSIMLGFFFKLRPHNTGFSPIETTVRWPLTNHWCFYSSKIVTTMPGLSTNFCAWISLKLKPQCGGCCCCCWCMDLCQIETTQCAGCRQTIAVWIFF